MHNTSSNHKKVYMLQPEEQKVEEQKTPFYEILPLGKQREDLFMDVFSKDYIKILKQIDKKKKMFGEEQTKRQQTFRKPSRTVGLKHNLTESGPSESDLKLPGDSKPDLARGVTLRKNQKKEKPFGINETEFCHINFDQDWPLIVRDLAHILGGVDFLKGNKIREEEEEV